jgi:hypothetical protein
MSWWGNVWNVDHTELHVVPCDNSGKVCVEHGTSLDCRCQPYRDDQVSALIIHRADHSS